MPFEEHAELVQPRVSDDVDEHAAAGWVDADRESFREVPGGPRTALADGDVGQLRGLDPSEGRELCDLLLGRSKPYQVGVFDDGVEDRQALDGVCSALEVAASVVSARRDFPKRFE